MEKTAFEALGEIFHYKRLYFGVRNAVPKFQCIMIKCFGDLEGVFIYLDNVVFGGRTWEEHDKNLTPFFERCKCLNVSLNRKKCIFGTSQLSWLGYLLENNCLKPDPERLVPHESYKQPENLKQLEALLGMATYYSKFVYGFAEKIKILQTIKNSKTFVWSAQAKQSFDSNKTEVSKSFLAVPDFNRPMTLETDASGSAIAGEPCNSIKRFDLWPFDQDNSTYSQPTIQCYLVRTSG